MAGIAGTAIGLETGRKRTQGHDALQGWMAEHGLQPYLPQLVALASYNIGLQYDAGQKRLKWPAAAVEAAKAFAEPMVFHYNAYHYAQQPGALRWEGQSQDALPISMMTSYLAQTRQWLTTNGIALPWMMVDEPPPPTGINNRWTQEIEDRIIKFVQAAQASGWTVGVCVPGPSQLAYWADRLAGVRWILNAKYEHEAYRRGLAAARAGGSVEVWLYNRRDGFDGLAAQMREMGATGYLHWAAEWRENPLATVDEEGFEVLPGMWALLRELAAMEAVTLEGLDERLTAVEKAVFGMRIG